MHSRAPANDRRDVASMEIPHADGSSSEAWVNAESTAARAVVRVIRQTEPPITDGERRGIADISDTSVFGGVCDRCGRPYLQRCFPHGLCSNCALDGSNATRPELPAFAAAERENTAHRFDRAPSPGVRT